MKRGIDISKHNGDLNFKELAKKYDFAIIRAGYGKNNIDNKMLQNVVGCEEYNIPYGFYWFSYAVNPEMAKKEADYMCDMALNFNPKYPLAFDFEYGSIEYMKKQGVTPTMQAVKDIAIAFLNRIEENGYFAMLYSNRDFLTRYFDGLEKRYCLWLAEWNKEKPTIPCGIWQRGINDDGIDDNISYKDFPMISAKMKTVSDILKHKIFEGCDELWWTKYYRIAYYIVRNDIQNIKVLCKNNNLDPELLLKFCDIIRRNEDVNS